MKKFLNSIGFFILFTIFSNISHAALVSFWGTVEMDRVAAPSGVVVSVYDAQGNLIANRTTFLYGGKAYYILDFSAEGKVYLKVAGINASGLLDIGSGGSKELNLSVNRLGLGEHCEYDVACSSGYCVGGICSERVTGGGGGGAPSPATGGYFRPTCELNYTISTPSKLSGYLNESLNVPINISILKATCEPVEISISLQTPWENKTASLKNLYKGDKKTFSFDIFLKEEGNFTLIAKSGNLSSPISLEVMKKEIITTTIEIPENLTTITTTTLPIAPTGLFALILRNPFIIAYILFGIAIIVVVTSRIRKKRR
jgi:hypothetical protein